MLVFLIAALIYSTPPDARVTEHVAFGLKLFLPDKTEKAPGRHPSTVFFRNKNSGLQWFVERRGDGTFSQPPIPLTELAERFANASGGTVLNSTIASFAGARSVLVSFRSGEKLTFAHIFLDAGYVFGLGVTGRMTEEAAVRHEATRLARSTKLTGATAPEISRKTLAQLGLVAPALQKLPAHPLPNRDGLCFTDSPKGIAICVVRIPRGIASITGKPLAAVANEFFGNCDLDIQERTEVAGKRGLVFACSVPGMHATDVDYKVSHLFEAGNWLYVVETRTRANNRSGLLEYARTVTRDFALQ